MILLNNNEWFHYTDADAALVFIHGLGSDSAECWLANSDNNDTQKSVYWPSLVEADQRFGDIAIYLGGYASGKGTPNYDIRSCAYEVFSGLGRCSDKHPHRQTVLDKPKITFVCHSQGGIVVRYLLLDEREAFRDKKVGLVLIASPSFGSRYANGVEPLTSLLNYEQAEQLQHAHPFLADLDDRFKELHEKLPGLAGIEFYETQSPFARVCPWFPFLGRFLIVPKSSAARYFKARAIPNASHGNICTPHSMNSHIHNYLLDFLRDETLLPGSDDARSRTPNDGVEGVATPEANVTCVPSDCKLSLVEELSATMSNPNYEQDLLKLDFVYETGSVINPQTVIIVTGTIVAAELLDRPLAELIRDNIDKAGKPFPLRRAIVLSDAAWYSDKRVLANNPVIAVGGPVSNKLSKEFSSWVPSTGSNEGTYPIAGSIKMTGFFRLNEWKLPQVGLWGDHASDTREAIKHYISDPKGLVDFLHISWKPHK